MGVLSASTASAYTDGGCKWNSSTLYVEYIDTTGDYRTSFTQAAADYRNKTDAKLNPSFDQSNAFGVENYYYGNTGWEGYTSWACLNFGRKSFAASRLNMTYLDGASTARKKVVWLHELGHGLGLGHVSSIARVMYTSASDAYYSGGVRTLTSDEISGINSWY